VKYVFAVLAILWITQINGCASPAIVQISPDTYMLTRSSAAGMFANMSKLKAGVIQEANEFAARQGKVAIPISQQQRRPEHGFPSFEYQFRVVDPDDPEARRTVLAAGPDIVVQTNQNIDAKLTNSKDSRESIDLYTELTKLDDLRKRGILSDSEFEAQKKKLLNEN